MTPPHRIKNFAALAQNPAREAALKLAEVAFQALDTRAIVRRAVSLVAGELRVSDATFPLADKGRVFVVGVGKCSLEAVLELEQILGERITDGVVVDVRRYESPKRVRFYLGDHPFPTENNINATAEIIKLLAQVNQDDLVIFIISGGGSALLCQPGDHTCLEEVAVIKHLFRSGATIGELNTVRKHLSLARGGYLAKYAYPARVVSLIFSDVPGNDIGVVASGPTVLDTTTIEDAKKVIGECDNDGECNLILEHLIETPKEQKYFERVTNMLILTNAVPLRAMADLAPSLGLTATIKDSALAGEDRATGEAIARAIAVAPAKSVYFYGGETMVVIRGMGRGGRNQELALAALPLLSAGECVLAFASDGVDNGSDHAGAICDTITGARARAAGLDPAATLDQNDSYPFFSTVGDYLDTGYIGANVSDLIVALKL